MACEVNIGISGGNPSVYLTGDNALNDMFLHLEPDFPGACTYPIPATNGGHDYSGGGSHEWRMAYRPGWGNDVPGDESITGLNFVVYGAVAAGGTIHVKTYVIIDGTRYDLVDMDTSDSSYIQYTSSVLATRPDSSPWTKANIIKAIWGFEHTASFNIRAAFTEVYWTSPSGGGSLDVVAIAPDTGPATGGTDVIIVGSGFDGVSAVKFGTLDATSFNVDSLSQISAVTPAHANGAVDVSVTTS